MISAQIWSLVDQSGSQLDARRSADNPLPKIVTCHPVGELLGYVVWSSGGFRPSWSSKTLKK